MLESDFYYSPTAQDGGLPREIPDYELLTASFQTALNGLVDFEGWAPPAGTPIKDVIANYAKYRKSAMAPMLGRLVLRGSHYTYDDSGALRADLNFLIDYMGEHKEEFEVPWKISMLLPDPVSDLSGFNDAVYLLEHFNGQERPAKVDTVEISGGAAAIPIARNRLPEKMRVCLEVPGTGDNGTELRNANSQRSWRTKIRTGGSDRPTPEEQAANLARLHQSDKSYKFSGGQHDPVSHMAEDGRVLFGYLNTIVASAVAESFSLNRQRIDRDLVAAVLSEEDPNAFDFRDNRTIGYGEVEIDSNALYMARRRFGSIGSCSFEEMVDGLRMVL